MQRKRCKTINKNFFFVDFPPKTVPGKLNKDTQIVSKITIPNLTIELQLDIHSFTYLFIHSFPGDLASLCAWSLSSVWHRF